MKKIGQFLIKTFIHRILNEMKKMQKKTVYEMLRIICLSNLYIHNDH